jgi:hypothetical protein
MHSRGMRRWVTALVAGMCLALSGCGDDDDNNGDDGGNVARREEEARARLVHAAPGVGPVDIYLEGSNELLFEDVSYGQATDYKGLAPGDYQFALRAANAAADAAPLFVSASVTVAVARPVTLVATTEAGAGGAQTVRLISLEEALAGGNEPRVVVVHASPDAPAVALDVGADGTVEVAQLEPYQATATEGLVVPQDQATSVRVLTGTPATPVTSFVLPPLEQGARALIILAGLVGEKPRLEQGLVLLVVREKAELIRQNPLLYTLHASPDAPAVDLFIGDIEIADDLTFGNLSPPLRLRPNPEDPYKLDVFPHTPGSNRPAGNPLATLPVERLEAGNFYLNILTGFLTPEVGQQELRVVTVSEAFTPQADALRLRLVHAAAGVATVDVGPVGADNQVAEQALINNLAFGEASAPEGLLLSGAPVTLGVVLAEATDRTPVARFTLNPAPLAGREFFAVAAGTLTPRGGEQGFRLLVVDIQGQAGVKPWERRWEVTPQLPDRAP